jgi:hypothetical protein
MNAAERIHFEQLKQADKARHLRVSTRVRTSLESAPVPFALQCMDRLEELVHQDDMCDDFDERERLLDRLRFLVAAAVRFEAAQMAGPSEWKAAKDALFRAVHPS